MLLPASKIQKMLALKEPKHFCLESSRRFHSDLRPRNPRVVYLATVLVVMVIRFHFMVEERLCDCNAFCQLLILNISCTINLLLLRAFR